MTQEEIAVKAAQLEQRCRSNQRRIDRLESRQSDLEKLCASVQVLATRQETVEADLKEIKTGVKDLAAKPARRWESVVAAALAGIVGVLVSMLLK